MYSMGAISPRYCYTIGTIGTIVYYNDKYTIGMDSMGAISPWYCYDIGTISTIVYFNEYRQGMGSMGAILPRYCYDIGTIDTIVNYNVYRQDSCREIPLRAGAAKHLPERRRSHRHTKHTRWSIDATCLYCSGRAWLCKPVCAGRERAQTLS